ncbi:alpha/beta hydrolase-fold protein [Mucilaginibacter flavus]|uniref:alpha/beta hydrolase-fold protein n=1 Tax=Mucilaginibacter flavus TaxID=931504 RepID=UPI0025B2FF85|nr:alpha/beta hydrolase-fold protein [Mucilaginibacter flavus]MDN3584598.1 alpha/beta hydrolase-fold protein [Mucilaginibacter flavus]
MKYYILLFFLLLVTFAKAQRFYVSYKPSVYKGPFTGNVILYLSNKNENPKNETGWPCYRMKVKNIMPDQQIVFDDSALSYPTLLSRAPRGNYYVQAVWDLNIDGRIIGQSTGNMFNSSRKVNLNDTKEAFALVCDQVVPPPVFANSKYVKQIKVSSKLLTKFSHKQEYIQGAVILPKQYYTETKRRFPVYFMIAGFGGGYIHYSKSESSDTAASVPLDTVACIKVYLDGDCSLGHSAYANSDNNGPVGDAFAYEFIPQLDKQYRTNGARLIRGHSSGGWTVVYLLTHYPKLFVAGNASAPDPVDFRRFSSTNLYQDRKLNRYVDGLTMDRPSILDSVVYDKPNITHSIEGVFYRGQQNVSFDAVFGPKGSDMLPERMFDPETLLINPAVVNYWKRYDLTQYVIARWPDLKKDLQGKLRISVGTEDTEQCPAVRLMEEEMKKLGAGITFAYYPGDHFSVVTGEYKKAWDEFLLKRYLEWLKL